MPESDEKKKIIELVADGKISAADAEKLLQALPKKKPQENKKIVFMIEEEEVEKVKIQIPIFLAKLGANFIPSQTKLQTNLGSTKFNLHEINWKEILQMAVSGEEGDLFYMDIDDDDGKRKTIRIYVA
jgi:hypothetical protein